MNDEQTSTPWWRHGMVWLVIAGPAAVVIAGFATLAIALASPDPVLATTDTPAVQARNHAATPGRPPGAGR
jgi:hypothetical protein